MKSGFLDKLIARLDQVDPSEVQRLVTRLVREKGFFESVFEALQEGVLIIDPDGKITYVNHSASRIFGINPAKSIGKSLASTIRGLDWKKLSDPERVVSRDMEILYPEHRHLNFYLSPMKGEADSDIHLLGYVLIVRDITESLKRAEEDVESEKLNALTLLAAGVAHEIGNPLNSLDIHLQLLGRKINKLPLEDQSGLEEHLFTAQGEIRRLDGILKQFLQAIRPTQPERSPLHLHDLLQETLSSLAPELSEKKVEINLNLATKIPVLQLDGNQLQQAFYNLLKNAFQAMPATGGQIDISSHVTDYEVTMTIKDYGSGISPEIMGSIFEPFRSTKEAGTGLGLLIVRRIIREHGGEIEIDSSRDEGTIVTISLPRSDIHVRQLAERDTDWIDLDQTSDLTK
ncbi:MAG: two-component system sensor histidine kinase NtrB [Akkermansiaceae bacterium]